jgi:6-pyruvoyltetrahydropterin/6-carboxytetrahydropterin synthase
MNSRSVVSLTRRYHFAASHRLHAAHLTDAENLKLYGKCNNPYGHGHDYVLELTVSGELDQATGLFVPLAQLDRFVNEKILRLFAYRNINLDVPQFASLVPTTENVAVVIGDLLHQGWREFFGNSPIRPSRVHLQETDRNGFELFLPVLEIEKPSAERNESLMVHA